MSHHPASRSTVAPSFAPVEWELLVRLPGRLLIAAISAATSGLDGRCPDGTHTQALAGLEAIAAGRASTSRLIRDLVVAIYSEQLAPPGAAGDGSPAGCAAGDVADVLADCRGAVRIVARRAGDAEAAAFRDWLLAIATAVCAAGPPGAAPAAVGPGGVRVSPLRRRFLVDLSLAFVG